MGFEGSASSNGLGRTAAASANKRAVIATIAGGNNATDELRIVGLCNISVNVVQTAGAVANSTFQLFVVGAGDGSAMQIGPPNAIAGLNIPAYVNFPGIVGNNVLVQCTDGGGGGPASFTVLMMACA